LVDKAWKLFSSRRNEKTAVIVAETKAELIHNLDRLGNSDRLHGAAESTVEPSHHPMQVYGAVEVVLRSREIFD
jgi:hypothetical protein